MKQVPSQDVVEERLERANDALDEYVDDYEKITHIEWDDSDLDQRTGRLRDLIAEIDVLLGRLSGTVFGEGVDTTDAEEELRTTRRYVQAYMNETAVDETSRR